MLNRIKQILLKKKEPKEYLSHIKFKESIKASAMETYRNITILYLEKPKLDSEIIQPIYHFFYKKEFYYGEADTLDELESVAHVRVNELLN